MRVLSKLLLAVMAVVVAGSMVMAKEWEKIRIATEGAYPPFSEVGPDGKVKGFDVDIANALCEAMEAECTIVEQDWDGIIPALLAKKYDAIIASMSITEERKQKVDFTNRYYMTPAKFARKKGSDIEITKEGLKGKTVGVQRETVHDKFVTAEFPGAEIKRYGKQDEAYLDAVSGRLDLLLADSIPLSDGFLKTEKGADWEFVGPGFTDPQYFGEGIGIAVRQENDDLKEMFNEAIAKIRKDGTYKEINDKYFEFDIYGSEGS